MEISVPGYEPVTVTDCRARNAILSGLVQNSEYKVTVLVYATDSSIKTYFLTIKTPIDVTKVDETPVPETINVLKEGDLPTEEQPTAKPRSKRAGLVGMKLV